MGEPAMELGCIAPTVSKTATATTSPVIDDLISRSRLLLSELEAFRDRLRTLRQEKAVKYAHFRSQVESELKKLERASLLPESKITENIVRCSNLIFLETLWSIAKKSKHLVALQHRVYLASDTKSLSQGMHQLNLKRIQLPESEPSEISGPAGPAIFVDIVSDGGRIWTKISSLTNRRLLFDLAKQGWESDSSDQDDDFSVQEPIDRDVPLLKAAKDLSEASKMFRIRTKQPSVRLILPRVEPDMIPEVDKILDDCRRCGVQVLCGRSLDPPSTLDEALSTMAPDPITAFSETLNIDCTILLALVSDFSHAKVSKEAWFHAELQRQVEIEHDENVLDSLLYPALGSHDLVCTKEAVKTMREIVETLGTPSEKARTAILMGDDKTKPQEQLVQEMAELSVYAVPECWQLPVRIVDRNEDRCQAQLPSGADLVSESMTDINKSVFMYGWATGRTTITSNRTAVKQLENDLEKLEGLEDEVLPKVWVCPTSRSLVGKEKRAAVRKKPLKT